MLKIGDLKKFFNSSLALNGISFEAKPGELIGLLGSNGAGKSTCLRILSTYLAPSAGDLELCEFSYRTQRLQVSKLVGYVPDNPALYLDMTVREYLEYLGTLRGITGASLKFAIDRVVCGCHLTEVVNLLCNQLSRGFRQRVSLAQALIHQPQLLLLDEPTTGLDPDQLNVLNHILTNASKTSIVLFSSHLLAEVASLCTRVLVFDAGQLRDDLSLVDVDLKKQYSAHDKLKEIFSSRLEQNREMQNLELTA